MQPAYLPPGYNYDHIGQARLPYPGAYPVTAEPACDGSRLASLNSCDESFGIPTGAVAPAAQNTITVQPQTCGYPYRLVVADAIENLAQLDDLLVRNVSLFATAAALSWASFKSDQTMSCLRSLQITPGATVTLRTTNNSAAPINFICNVFVRPGTGAQG